MTYIDNLKISHCRPFLGNTHPVVYCRM